MLYFKILYKNGHAELVSAPSAFDYGNQIKLKAVDSVSRTADRNDAFRVVLFCIVYAELTK